MAAYVVVTVDVDDEQALAAYRDRAPLMAAEFGGRLVGWSDVVGVSGGVMPLSSQRMIIYEFYNMAKARQWHLLPNAQPEHAEIRALRQRAGAVAVTFIDGNSDGSRDKDEAIRKLLVWFGNGRFRVRNITDDRLYEIAELLGAVADNSSRTRIMLGRKLTAMDGYRCSAGGNQGAMLTVDRTDGVMPAVFEII